VNTNILYVILSAAVVNNFVFVKFMGICPVLNVSRKPEDALKLSGVVTAVMFVSTLITQPLYDKVLRRFGLEFMRTFFFILVVASLVQICERVIKRREPELYESLGIFLPLTAANGAVLGLVTMNVEEGFTFWASILNALGTGLGFTLAMFLMSEIQLKIRNSDIPESFRGLPSVLIASSIVSLAFFGFNGLLDGIFGM
jgi:electron transport complex protein RnfA